MPRRYDKAGDEPSLDEVFADPVVQAVMRRDRVSREALCRVIQAARLTLGLPPHHCTHAFGLGCIHATTLESADDP